MSVAGPRNKPDAKWTEDRVALAKKLWLEGQSAQQVADALGGWFTRNAVVGKMHRLGLSRPAAAYPKGGHTQTNAKPRTRKAPAVSRNGFAGNPWAPSHTSATPKPPTPVAPPPEPTKPSLDLALEDLGKGQCKFPFGDLPYRFCGHPVHEKGAAYCDEHHALCHPPLTATQRQGFKGLVRALRRHL